MIIGLYKAKFIHARQSRRRGEYLEFATMDRGTWLNIRRLLELIDCLPPAERKAIYYQGWKGPTKLARLNQSKPWKTRAVQSGKRSYPTPVYPELASANFRRNRDVTADDVREGTRDEHRL
jgi:hypothetical protein